MAAQMANTKSWQRDSAADLIDEIPASYKDIDVVMADQNDLVEIEHTLHQVLNYRAPTPASVGAAKPPRRRGGVGGQRWLPARLRPRVHLRRCRRDAWRARGR